MRRQRSKINPFYSVRGRDGMARVRWWRLIKIGEAPTVQSGSIAFHQALVLDWSVCGEQSLHGSAYTQKCVMSSQCETVILFNELILSFLKETTHWK